MADKDPVIEALRVSLEQNPKQGALWIHYAELLAQSNRADEAINALRQAASLGIETVEVGKALVPLLRESGQLAEALIRAEQILEEAEVPEVREEFNRIQELRAGGVEPAESVPAAPVEPAKVEEAPVSPAELPGDEVEYEDESEELREELSAAHDDELSVEDWASQFDWGDLHTTFEDVIGLDEVKRAIRLRIIAPMEKQGIYEAFSRSAGGGILLYGPPGCGKTFIAKATAGECNARFVSVGIHEILDRYYGESEKLVHSLFEEARRRTPTVLFFDEFDALAGGRSGNTSQFYKTLVDQLLQEMDGMSGSNEGILVFAATNVPWHIDSAFRRPGRFDRLFFVPPPDGKARAGILEKHLSKLPGGDKVAAKKLAKRANLFTGADLVSLCERASERALERSLESDEVHPVELADFERVLDRMSSTAEEWLATARNYARYANEGGQYDDLRDFLRSVKKL